MVKRSKIITQLPKTIENPNIIDIKLVTVEHPETSCIFSKTIKQSKKVSQVGDGGKNSTSLWHSEIKKLNFFDETKTMKKIKNNETISCKRLCKYL